MSYFVDSAVWLFFAAVIGLCVGSFLNVVIYRLPIMQDREERSYVREYLTNNCPQVTNECSALTIDKGEFNLLLPRSHCPYCQHKVEFFDNIPVISWLLLKGRCRYCHHTISKLYPLTELNMAFISVFLAYFCLTEWQWLFLLTFSAMLFSAAMIDYHFQVLPDSLTLPLLWTGLIWHCINDSYFLPDAIFGAIIGYLLLWLLYWGFKLLKGKEGLGYGDFKLLAALGAWSGWRSLPQILLIAASLSLVVAIIRWRREPDSLQRPLSFGPGLATGGCWFELSSLFFIE